MATNPTTSTIDPNAAVILATDIITRLPADGQAQVTRRNELLGEIVASMDGAEIAGQASARPMLATFATPADAVRAALRFVIAVEQADWGGTPIDVRIAIDEQVKTGRALALLGLGAEGQVLLTRGVFNEARAEVGAHPVADLANAEHAVEWMSHGRYLLKSSNQAVDVFEVGARGHAPLDAPAGTSCAQRIVTPDEEAMLGWRPSIGAAVPGRSAWWCDELLETGPGGETWLITNARTGEQRASAFIFERDSLDQARSQRSALEVIEGRLSGHPHIAPLLAVHLDRPPFYVERAHAGATALSQWGRSSVKLGAVPVPTRLRIAEQIAMGVSAAHALGVIHGDLTPQDVLIEDADTRQPVARVGGFAGAMALRSSSQHPSVRDDVEALALLVAQLDLADLTAKLDRTGDIADPIVRQLVIDATTSTGPGRIATADGFVERLREAIDPSSVRTPRVVERPRGAMTGVMAAAMILLLLGAAAMTGLWVQTKDDLDQAVADAQTVQAERRAALALIDAFVEATPPDPASPTSAWLTTAADTFNAAIGAGEGDAMPGSATLATMLDSAGLHAKALPHAERALIALERTPATPERDTLAMVEISARGANATGDPERAEALWRRALATHDRIDAEGEGALRALESLAALLIEGGRADDAFAFAQRAATLADDLYPDSPALRAPAHYLVAQSTPADPIPPLEQAHTLAAADGAASPLAQAISHDLAQAMLRAGRIDDAESVLTARLSAARVHLGDADPITLSAMHDLAGFLASDGRALDASFLYREALAGRSRTLGRDHADTLDTMLSLAALHEARGELDQAEPLYTEVVRRMDDTADPLRVAGAQEALAQIHATHGRYESAAPLLERSLELKREALPTGNESTIATAMRLATIYRDLRLYDDAERVLTSAYSALPGSAPDDDARRIMLARALAELFDTRGDSLQAADWRERVPKEGDTEFGG